MRVEHQALALGNAGILQTVERIWDFILYRAGDRRAGPNPRVRVQAEIILLSRCEWSSCPIGMQAALIYTWVQRHMVYVRDHLTWEELRDTDYQLDRIDQFGTAPGDCDDFVILMGALLASVGIPFSLMLTSDREDGEFTHVWLVADTERGPIPMDAITQQPFGWMVPRSSITNAHEVPMPGA